MSAEANRQTVTALYQALNQHDLSGFTPYIAEDVHLLSTAFGIEMNSLAGLQQFLGGFVTAFPDLTLTVERQMAAEQWVVNELTWSGTHTGPLHTPTGVIPPTGKRVERVPMCEIFTFEDGKVARLVNYHDTATWLRQLGLV